MVCRHPRTGKMGPSIACSGPCNPAGEATRQSMSPVLPKHMIAPWPNRSVPEWQRCIEITVGAWYESTAAPCRLSLSGVKACQDGQADSPAHKNPKSQLSTQPRASQHQTGFPEAHETTLRAATAGHPWRRNAEATRGLWQGTRGCPRARTPAQGRH